MKRKHSEKHAFFSLFWPKMRVLELNMGLFNSLEISTSNKLHCRIIWLNMKGVECQKVGKIWRRIVRMVVSYPNPSCFRQYAAYLRRPYSVTGFIKQWRGGCNSDIYQHFCIKSMLMLYLSVMKQIRVWQDIFSSKRKIIWKASIALILNKCPKMDENECNLAGDTITLNDDISSVIHCIRFVLWTFMMIKTKACYRHKIILGGCYKTAHHQIPPRLM